MVKVHAYEESENDARPTKSILTIGGIDPAKSTTKLHISTRSNPSTVHDENGNLVCFFAKQMISMNDQEHPRENNEDCITPPSSSSSSSIVDNIATAIRNQRHCKDDYYYFFSPLYFGESPVACLFVPKGGIESDGMKLYTFKRKYEGHPVAEREGYFGGKSDCF